MGTTKFLDWRIVGCMLAEPWQRQRNVGRLWQWVLSVAILPLPVVFVWIDQDVGRAALLGRLVFLLLCWSLWDLQFKGLRRQNHPTVATLVPGHVWHLRLAVALTWLGLTSLQVSVLSVPMLSAMDLRPAMDVACNLSIVGGLIMLGFALTTSSRWALPIMFVCFVALLVGSTFTHSVIPRMWEAFRQMLIAHPLLVAGISQLLMLAWVASLLRTGGPRHRQNYHEQIRPQTSTMGHLPKIPGSFRPGPMLSHIGALPYRRWLERSISRQSLTSQDTHARAMLALGPAIHWTGLVGNLLLAAIVVPLVLVAFSTGAWLRDVDVLIRDPAFIFFFGTTCLVTLVRQIMLPILAMPRVMHQTRREQCVLTLLPGMSHGFELNRAIAKAIARDYAVSLSFLLALVLVAAPHPSLRPFMSLVLAAIPAILWTLRDWSRYTPMSALGTALALIAVSTWLFVVGFCLLVVELPVGAVATAIAIPTAAIFVWRWRKLASYPRPFPVGRLA